ncbi:MAG: HPr family phosphocarrier protein [Deltaproteobacteria bacterium]|nr:HPr family phosphocarrier protein [Deltaproteobacteria bacterium]MBW2417665.1 HPr family phosphocarrier protein [Deltaproteobacteria bacterium]
MSNAVEQEFTVRAELGLHARPAGRFAALASKFESEISVGRAEEWVNGCSVLSILSLAAARGTVLRVRAEGADAVVAVEQLGALIESPEESAASGA